MTDKDLREAKELSFKLYLKIKNIDPEAAEYFWKNISERQRWGSGLLGAFAWDGSPQGTSFWYNIYMKLA